MKTNTIIRIVLWCLMSVVFVALLLGGLGLRTFRFIPKSSAATEFQATGALTEVQAETGQIRRIKIEWVSGSVQVTTGAVEKIRFSEPDGLAENDKLVWNQSGDVLTIKFNKGKHSRFGLEQSAAKPLTVTIPEKWSGSSLNIKTVSADVRLSDLHIPDVQVDAVSAAIVCSNLVCESLNLETVSGSIRCDGQVKELNVESISGDCNLTAVNSPKEITMSSISGNLSLTLPLDIPGFTAVLDSISGSLSSDFSGNGTKQTQLYGNGSCSITAETVSGNLSIHANNLGEA